MNNPLIEEVRAARAARAESLDYDPHKIAEWARNAHAERQKMLESKFPNKSHGWRRRGSRLIKSVNKPPRHRS